MWICKLLSIIYIFRWANVQSISASVFHQTWLESEIVQLNSFSYIINASINGIYWAELSKCNIILENVYTKEILEIIWTHLYKWVCTVYIK